MPKFERTKSVYKYHCENSSKCSRQNERWESTHFGNIFGLPSVYAGEAKIKMLRQPALTDDD